MYETYRMLGAEHEADLERDARKWRRAADARAARIDLKAAQELNGAPAPARFTHGRVVALLLRVVGAGQ